MASTLGSLEALLNYLKSVKVCLWGLCEDFKSSINVKWRLLLEILKRSKSAPKK